MSINPNEELLRQSILQKIESKNKEKAEKKEAIKIAENLELSPKKVRRSIEDTPERLNRTLFIGNVPSKCCTDRKLQRELKAIFKAHGPVESLRFRSLALAEPMPRKYAFISGQLSERVDSSNAYIVMEKEEDAQKSLSENMRLFYGHHIRVDIAGTSGKLPSHKKSVFIGNIPLDASEENLWKTFSDCGAITSVRVVRDKKTGTGKGFAYVAFGDRAAVKSALLFDGSEIGGRKIRVQKCSKPGEAPKSRPQKVDEGKQFKKPNNSTRYGKRPMNSHGKKPINSRPNKDRKRQ